MKERVIYQVVTDRFAGTGGQPLKGLTRTGPAEKWVQFAGGNFDGLKERLSYIKALGASALWISPVYHNSYLPEEKGKKRNDGYHGYWIKDFERVDPAFGTEEQLESLLTSCADHDVKPILDVVLNHSNPTYSADRGDLWRDGELFARYRKDKNKYFHHLGFLDQTRTYSKHWWENANVWDLADLAQENPKVAEYLKEAHIKWLSMGFAGVRMDTALHVPATYLRQWMTEMRQAVPSCDFFFGEWWNGGPHNELSTEYSHESGMPLTDFGLAHTLRGIVSGKLEVDELGQWVAYQNDYSEPDLKVNFIDNHDMPRLMNVLIDGGFAEEQARKRLNLALVLMLLWRGVPCIYYGTELGLYTRRRARGKNWGQDPYNREPMQFPQEETEGMRLCRMLSGWRRDSDLIQHPLVWKATDKNLRTLSRGDIQLDLHLSKTSELRSVSLKRGGEEVWELSGLL